jgi:predicted anti-sigma-YlaC factor YlaD
VTGIGECAVVRQELGVHVLGALGPADRSVVELHLASCSRCREELAGLAALPALLRKVPAASAAILGGESAGEFPPGGPAAKEPLSALLSRVARVRRRRRWRLTAAAAVLIAATATAWGLRTLQPVSPPSAPAARQWAALAGGFNPVTRAGAVVRYSARAWGADLEVQVSGIPVGTICQFWVTSTTGQDIPAGAWTIAAGQRHAWYPASAPVPVSGLRSYEVTSAGKTLVTVQASTGPSSRNLMESPRSLDRTFHPVEDESRAKPGLKPRDSLAGSRIGRNQP